MTDIYERINAGEYEPRGEYPSWPEKPAVLSKRAGDITPEEFASLAKVKTDYEAAKAAYRDGERRWTEEQNAGEERFRADLLAYHGLPDDDFSGRLYGIAWRQGHSAGYSSVASCFEDIADLYEVARKTFGGRR